MLYWHQLTRIHPAHAIVLTRADKLIDQSLAPEGWTGDLPLQFWSERACSAPHQFLGFRGCRLQGRWHNWSRCDKQRDHPIATRLRGKETAQVLAQPRRCHGIGFNAP